MKSRHPVKMVYDRMEDLAATTKRHPSRTRHRTALDKDGKLLAMEIDLATDGGAYSTLSSTVLSRATLHAAGPYSCPNVRIRANYFYMTNNNGGSHHERGITPPAGGACRGDRSHR